MPGDPHVSITPSADADTPPGEVRRDDTPPAPDPIRGTPARQDEQRWTPSLIALGALLAVAAIFAVVLLVNANRGDDPPADLVESTAPTSGAAVAEPPDAESPPAADIAAGTGQIVGVQAWDPYGDNGSENDAQASLALADGVASTSWSTECYQNRFMGGKDGVGLILELDGAATGTVSVETLNAPYQIDVYTATATTAPTAIDGWTQIGDTRFDDAPAVVETGIESPATHVLIWLSELGRDDACTSTNPFRGRLGEISFRP